MQEIIIALTWYISLFTLGIVGLGFGSKIFEKFPDRGYGFSKFLGLFITGMVLWILSSLRIVPFNTLTVYIVLVLCLSVSVFLIVKNKVKINKHFIFHEICFLILFAVWAVIRSSNPQAEGTEKMMNIAFMNSISRTEYFPPTDIWMPPLTINYYYLGHYLFVFLGKIAGVQIAYVYNLALVSIIAQIFVSLNSIFLKLFQGKKTYLKVLVAVLTSFWITFGSNLHYIYKFLESLRPLLRVDSLAEGWRVFQILKFTYWFPDGTRIIPFVIDEFPGYSIVLGDVHGHYIGLPFLIIAVGFLIASFYIKINSKDKLIFNSLISLFIAALYGINSWDFITVNFLFVLLHLYQAVSSKIPLYERALAFIIAEACLIFPGLIFMLPYLLAFNPPVGGIGLVPLDAERKLLPWLQMWGAFILLTIPFVYAYARKFIKKFEEDKIAILLLIAALCLIVGVEVFFVKDIFHESNNAYFRTNTVFKFYYHAWALWGIACGYFVYTTVKSFLAKKKTQKEFKVRLYSYIIFVALLFASCYSYIFEAVGDFYNLDTKKPDELTLDGNRYIQNLYPEDYEAIQWLKSNVEGQPIIVEAVGNAYTYFTRVSSSTGLPTVVGWPTHEWQWRGSGDMAFERQSDVSRIYQTNEDEEFVDLIKEHNVVYIFVGGKERETYVDLNEEFMKKYGEIVFQKGTTVIYKIKR